MDLFDAYLRKQMKFWAARLRTPKDGRARLLAAAAQEKQSGKPHRWLPGSLHFKFSPIPLNTIAAMIHMVWPPVQSMPFIESRPTPGGRSYYTSKNPNDWSSGLLHLGLLCSSNSNSVGFRLRL
jgi:hypothetical protein